MKNVLIIGAAYTGCQILSKLNDYHHVLYRSVKEGIKIVSVDQIELEKQVKKLTFDVDEFINLNSKEVKEHLYTTRVNEGFYPSLDSIKDRQERDRKQQHKWAVRNYRK